MQKNALRPGRSLCVDLVKAAAILLVVWGHLVQYLHGAEYDYWSDGLFRWIYGFHMPLFALVSGYLYARSKKPVLGTAVRKKAKRLLLPVLSWALLLTLLDCGFNILTHEHTDARFAALRFLTRCAHDLWFLKGIFLCFLLTAVTETITKKPTAAAAVLALLCVSTVLWPKAFDLHLYGFLLPYHAIGYAAGARSVTAQRLRSRKYTALAAIVLAAIYLALLRFYQKPCFIYTSGLSVLESPYGVWKQAGIDLYRFLIGLVGCGMTIAFCAAVRPSAGDKWAGIVTNVSNATLTVYVLTASACVYLPAVLSRAAFHGVLTAAWTDVLLLPVSIVLVGLCVRIDRALAGTKISVLLFGK